MIVDVDRNVPFDGVGVFPRSQGRFAFIDGRIAGFQPDFGFPRTGRDEPVGIDVFHFPFVESDDEPVLKRGGIHRDDGDRTEIIGAGEIIGRTVFPGFPEPQVPSFIVSIRTIIVDRQGGLIGGTDRQCAFER